MKWEFNPLTRTHTLRLVEDVGALSIEVRELQGNLPKHMLGKWRVATFFRAWTKLHDSPDEAKVEAIAHVQEVLTKTLAALKGSENEH
jgi:hypothetical protein